MRPFIAFALLVASVSATSYGGQQQHQQSFQPMNMGYGQAQSAPAAAAPSYGGYSAPAAPAETVRVSYGSQSQQDSPTPSYGHASSSPSMYQSQAAPVRAAQAPETVRISYSTSGMQQQRQEASGYGSSSSSDSGYGQAPSAPAASSGYGQAPAAPSQSYSAPVRSAPVETVRVSYGSGSSDMGSSYGGSYSQSQSAPAAAPSSYGSYGSSSTRNAVPILKHNQEINAGNSHNFDFSTGDGFTHSERTAVKAGSYKSYGSDESNAEVTKVGSYSYTSPEGKHIALSYQADANGFRAQGDHLPTPPPIPAEIAKSLRGGGY